jgi:hypothetical protein
MVVRTELHMTNPPAADSAGGFVVRGEADPGPADPLRAALSEAPVWEKQVLELALQWTGLAPDEEWAAQRLRVFLLTWDPFEWHPGRAVAFATSSRRVDGAGVVLYLPLWQAQWLADDDVIGLPAVLGQLAESVLAVGGEQRQALSDGSYAGGVADGTRPGLLARIPETLSGNAPTVTVVGPGWQPIQFDVLEDLGQDRFGPADLDRSPVRFVTTGDSRPGCPGCDGRVVEFPDGLKETQDVICAAHRAEALQITTGRLEAAKASNPAGWEALLDAGQRLLEPHLPNGLGPRMVAAAQQEAPSVSELRAAGNLVIGAAAMMAGLPDPETPLGLRLAPVRTWLEALPGAMATHGMDISVVSKAAEELLANPMADQLAAAASAAAQEAQAKPQPYRRDIRVGRNSTCPCGSGKKYKFCHGA